MLYRVFASVGKWYLISHLISTFVILSASGISRDLRAEELYTDKEDCIKKNTSAKSIPEIVNDLCDSILYKKPKTASEIESEKQKELLQNYTIPEKEFNKLMEQRFKEAEKRRQEEEEEERQEKIRQKQREQELMIERKILSAKCLEIENYIREQLSRKTSTRKPNGELIPQTTLAEAIAEARSRYPYDYAKCINTYSQLFKKIN